MTSIRLTLHFASVPFWLSDQVTWVVWERKWAGLMRRQTGTRGVYAVTRSPRMAWKRWVQLSLRDPSNQRSRCAFNSYSTPCEARTPKAPVRLKNRFPMSPRDLSLWPRPKKHTWIDIETFRFKTHLTEIALRLQTHLTFRFETLFLWRRVTFLHSIQFFAPCGRKYSCPGLQKRCEWERSSRWYPFWIPFSPFSTAPLIIEFGRPHFQTLTRRRLVRAPFWGRGPLSLFASISHRQ